MEGCPTAESLARFSNVCNGCFKTIYTLGMLRARSLGIPVIVTGLSRGLKSLERARGVAPGRDVSQHKAFSAAGPGFMDFIERENLQHEEGSLFSYLVRCMNTARKLGEASELSRRFAPQAEIYQYLRDSADKYDVRKHVRFSTEVLAAQFDEVAGEWIIDLSDGTTHRAGEKPLGGNNLYLDGHVESKHYKDVHRRDFDFLYN